MPMALINLADVYLRRNELKEVLELSHRSLELANASGNASTIATNKANIGFALMGLTYGPLGTCLAERFPTAVRYTGASVAFNLAGILGASIAPYLATWLKATEAPV